MLRLRARYLAAPLLALSFAAAAAPPPSQQAYGVPNSGGGISTFIGTTVQMWFDSTLPGPRPASTEYPFPVAVISGGTAGGSSGSVTAAGTNGTVAQAVQGITGGVPVPIFTGGATNGDFSANAAAVPIAGYVLLATIPATASRDRWEVQNQDIQPLQVVLDDGAGTAGTVSSIMLNAAPATGQGGGDTGDGSFKGRVRVYGPTSTLRVMVRQT